MCELFIENNNKEILLSDNVSMEEYIEMCCRYRAQAGMTNEDMKEHCLKLFPTTKRWKQC